MNYLYITVRRYVLILCTSFLLLEVIGSCLLNFVIRFVGLIVVGMFIIGMNIF